MEDEDVIKRIDALVDEEHQLHQQAALGEPLPESARERLKELEVGLDQCWDLLRQRRARRRAGEAPEAAEVRDPDVVEHYQQ